MKAMARRSDPDTSHEAAHQHRESGARGNQALAALRLVKKYPGSSYRYLWAKHVNETRRSGKPLLFENPVCLMRRLSEVAQKDGTETCPISGRRVAQWWPK